MNFHFYLLWFLNVQKLPLFFIAAENTTSVQAEKNTYCTNLCTDEGGACKYGSTCKGKCENNYCDKDYEVCEDTSEEAYYCKRNFG